MSESQDGSPVKSHLGSWSSMNIEMNAIEAAIFDRYNAAPAIDKWIIATVGEIQHVLDAMKSYEANGESPSYETDRDSAIDASDAAEAWALKTHGDQMRAGEMPIAYARDEDGYWLVWGW